FLGDPLIADLMLRSERIPPLSGPVVEIAHPELFDCLYTKTLPGDAAYSPRYEAFARKGSYVLYVCYSGYQDGESVLRALRDLFAEV
ncbi:MAG: hypothetical protein FWH28_03950, partial [Clostridiales bacterium]|nr:hypothetical protein [Clostridiales bacterium]